MHERSRPSTKQHASSAAEEYLDTAATANIPETTRVIMQGAHTKNFNYNSLNSKLRHNRQVLKCCHVL